MTLSHDLWVWLAVLGVSSTTVVTRCSFLVLGARARLPPIVERALRYAPAAALAALIGPELLAPGAVLDLNPLHPRLGGAIVAGMAGYTVLRLLG